MITVRNEFETIPAFEHIAGCSLGTWTNRETTAEMIRVLWCVSSIDTLRYWKELAELTDEDISSMQEMQQEIADDINEHAPLPPYCFVSLEDNEWRVIPYISYEVVRIGLMPKEKTEEELIFVNDHGNATFYNWDDSRQKYVERWSLV